MYSVGLFPTDICIHRLSVQTSAEHTPGVRPMMWSLGAQTVSPLSFLTGEMRSCRNHCHRKWTVEGALELILRCGCTLISGSLYLPTFLFIECALFLWCSCEKTSTEAYKAPFLTSSLNLFFCLFHYYVPLLATEQRRADAQLLFADQ